MSKTNMKTSALQLAARFSLPPNSLGYCGRDSAPEKFKKCAIEGNCDGVEEELTKFIVLHPYLKTIGDINKKDKFSFEVIEAYCIGNELLENSTLKDYHRLLDNFKEQGVPEWLIDELRKNEPKKFIPHHLFQVLHVGVGRASGSVPYNMETINNCMVRWGHVKKINDSSATVELNTLENKENVYMLTKSTEIHPFNSKLVPEIDRDIVVAVHWGQVIKSLSTSETEKLRYWTNRVIDALN